jgi:hypothetical protein
MKNSTPTNSVVAELEVAIQDSDGPVLNDLSTRTQVWQTQVWCLCKKQWLLFKRSWFWVLFRSFLLPVCYVIFMVRTLLKMGPPDETNI